MVGLNRRRRVFRSLTVIFIVSDADLHCSDQMPMVGPARCPETVELRVILPEDLHGVFRRFLIRDFFRIAFPGGGPLRGVGRMIPEKSFDGWSEDLDAVFSKAIVSNGNAKGAERENR